MKLGLMKHARRLARKNPLGLSEDVALLAGVVVVAIAGTYFWRRMKQSAWTEITSNPQINAGTTYRVTMAPVDGATIDIAQQGWASTWGTNGVSIVNPPFDSSWADTDTTRWHFQFVATGTGLAPLDATTRIWAQS